MQERSLSLEAALQELAGLLHRLALLQTVPDAVPADEPDRDRLQALATRFAAEDLQLDYQIALQGRADLWLAPDEYAGFTMTLLRMLAFAPQEGGEAAGGPLRRSRTVILRRRSRAEHSGGAAAQGCSDSAAAQRTQARSRHRLSHAATSARTTQPQPSQANAHGPTRQSAEPEAQSAPAPRRHPSPSTGRSCWPS